MPHRIEVELTCDRRMSEQCLWLRRIQQLALKDAVVQRLFAKAVASENEFFLSSVPQRNREHPVEMVDEIIAVFLVQMRYDLGIGLCDELVSLLFEFEAHVAIVVKLAV